MSSRRNEKNTLNKKTPAKIPCSELNKVLPIILSIDSAFYSHSIFCIRFIRPFTFICSFTFIRFSKPTNKAAPSASKARLFLIVNQKNGAAASLCGCPRTFLIHRSPHLSDQSARNSRCCNFRIAAARCDRRCVTPADDPARYTAALHRSAERTIPQNTVTQFSHDAALHPVQRIFSPVFTV